MNTLKLKCFNSDFPIIDMLLNYQEFELEPKYSDIILITEDSEYHYEVRKCGKSWYIIAD